MKYFSTKSSKTKLSLFWAFCTFVLLAGISLLMWKNANSELNVLPILVDLQHHKEPLRSPGVFREDTTHDASNGNLVFNADGTFSFEYVKSEIKNKPFTGCFFPLENVEIDFSKYDKIYVDVETNLARRIPFNLSVQNKKETHQYIRNFIEVKKGQTEYELRLEDFFTPTSWYDRNNISQAEIPPQDLSKIEALSFESCHLLKPGIKDQFRIKGFILKKDLIGFTVGVISAMAFIIAGLAILFLGLFNKKTQVVHVPIKHNEFNKKRSLDTEIIGYLAEHYNNPDLKLSDLTKEFGKSSNEISKIIREHSSLTFPNYLNFLRIEEAKRILKSQDIKTVSEVGYIVGFNSPSNFIRVFKRLEGTSPKKFAEE